jgi:Flp pilus assembly pilin Flp
MKPLLVRLIVEDGGQDLIEYALLSTAVGLAAAAGLLVLQNAIGIGYTARNTNVNNLWQPPNPAGS